MKVERLPQFRAVEFLKRNLRSTTRVSLELFKIMVPIIFLVHLLKYFDLVRFLVVPLRPVMAMLDLPPEAGVVWAMTMANNIYAGLIAFSSLGISQLTVAQATTLGLLMLVCHNLFIEVMVAKKCGLNIAFQVLFRLGSAIVMAFVVMSSYKFLGLFQGPAKIVLPVQTESLNPFQTVGKEVQNLASIYLIIFVLMVIMEGLERLGFMRFITKTLQVVLKPLELQRQILPSTAIGLSLGLTYGAGLILQSIQSQSIDRRSIFLSVSLMGICHALIEDTILVLAFGGEIIGLLLLRLILGYLFVLALAKIHSAFGRKRGSAVLEPQVAK
ncbi:MAG: hypothetical protein HRT45_08110 [Bdellovibrionales bacterium]|nr:hypothetical protein [Bdellovibrionales bacterium]